MAELRPYQTEGAAFLAERNQAYLADDMGLGKGCQFVTACDKINAERVLMVCPASVRGTLFREFQKWQAINRRVCMVTEAAGDVPDGAVVVIISYDLAVSDHWLAKLKTHKWDVIGFDEAHYLKAVNSQRSQKLIGQGGLAFAGKRHWFLSGTPIPNHLGELWTLLRVFFPQTLMGYGPKPLGYNDFLEKHCILVNSEYGVKVMGHKDLTQLRARMKPYFLRRKKSEVAKDLPPISFYDVPIEIPEDALADIMKAELSTDLLAVMPEGIPISLSTVARLHGITKVPAIVEMVLDSLNSGVEKIVVFAWHREVIEGIYKGIVDQVSVVGISGDTPPEKRDPIVQRFRDDPKTRVFIGQIKAAGTGVDGLQVAHQAIFAEMSWCPSDNAQAAMRLHRIGQTNPVTVRFAKLAGSLDEAVVTTLRRKTALINDVFTDLEKDTE